MRQFLALSLLCSWSVVHTANAQLGGTSSFAQLEVSPSARSAALGGVQPAIAKPGVGSYLSNPAAALAEGAAIGAAYNPYQSQFRYSSLLYQRTLSGFAIGGGVQYISYGTIDGYTPGGTSTGTYTAGAYMISANASKALGPFRAGATLKFCGAYLEAYNSSAVGADLGFQYKHPTEDFTAGLLVQNVGVVMSRFNQESRRLPANVQLGAAYKFAHMPVRFSLTAQHLETLDIVYLDPSYSVRTDATGSQVAEKKKISDQILRHFVIGAEFLLSKSLVVRGGYNHLRRREMRLVSSSSGAAGYSLGISLALKKLTLDYSHLFIAKAGGGNYLTLAYNLTKATTAPEPKEL